VDGIADSYRRSVNNAKVQRHCQFDHFHFIQHQHSLSIQTSTIERKIIMSSATVTSSMRAVAWNVHFTIGEDEDPGAFAGIYQVPGSNLVTFRDVCDELRLCFEYPYDISENENEKTWNDIAFSLNQDHSPSSLDPDLSFVTEAKMDQAVPSLAPLRPKEQNVLSYHIYYHKNCTLPPGSPLESHMQG
jgi:hypothetical protein